MMIVPLDLGQVTLPEGHPRGCEGVSRLFGYAIDHPDGVIVVDTGCGTGNALIDELYTPTVVGIVDALASVGIDERSVAAVVNTHLHFDHCGQNHALAPAPIWVTEAEVDAVATVEHYTVPEWACVASDRVRVAGDGEEIATGVRLVATPGHTPGHQSVVVTGCDERPDIIVGQACHDCAEFADGRLAQSDLHDPQAAEQARASLLRLRSLRPSSAYFSHDAKIFASP